VVPPYFGVNVPNAVAIPLALSLAAVTAEVLTPLSTYSPLQSNSVASLGTTLTQLAPSNFSNIPQRAAEFPPGSVGMCRPPPVQFFCWAALSRTHLAVTSEAHAFTPVAHNRKADADCSPSRPIVPCEAATRVMYCLTAGAWLANSNGTPGMRT